jgi:two-component system cell cycle sensor histidine kinase PleC
MVRHQVEAVQADLAVRLACEPPMLWADESKFKKMLLNLLSNALKFIDKGGKVSIAIQRDSEGGLRVAVEDNGPGIDAADIPRILEPFTQMEDSLDRQHNGVGLGLPLTKAIIELHGGTLTIDSEAGSGTTATLCFPAERLLSSAPAAAAR